MSTRVFDEESSTESKSNLAMKEISVVVANIDRFGPATNAFLDSPAANGIAGFMFSEMHVKEQGLVKLRSKFALQGVHSSVSAASQSELSQVGSCGGTATLFRSYIAISHPFGSIQPGAAGFDWSSITLLLKGTPVMFVSVYLNCNTGITGANLQKLSEIGAHVKDAGIPFVIQEIGTCRRPNYWNQAGPPHQRGSFASFRPGNIMHFWETDRLRSLPQIHSQHCEFAQFC